MFPRTWHTCLSSSFPPKKRFVHFSLKALHCITSSSLNSRNDACQRWHIIATYVLRWAWPWPDGQSSEFALSRCALWRNWLTPSRKIRPHFVRHGMSQFRGPTHICFKHVYSHKFWHFTQCWPYVHIRYIFFAPKKEGIMLPNNWVSLKKSCLWIIRIGYPLWKQHKTTLLIISFWFTVLRPDQIKHIVFLEGTVWMLQTTVLF